MDLHLICDTVMKLYLYADNAKRIHYTIESSHGHKLCDEIRDEILKFVDDLAEQSFGYVGKPSWTDFKDLSKLDIYEVDDLAKLCGHVKDLVEALQKSFADSEDDDASGIISLMDDFKGSMDKMKFLTTFDKVSNA